MENRYYHLDFFGLKRILPVSYLSPKLKIANFNILGDIEFCEKAGEELVKMLKKRKIKPACFVGSDVKIVPFVHHMGKRYGHKRYVILRKSIKGYMISPIVQYPAKGAPPHVKKQVLSKTDKDYLISLKEGIVLINDVVSTGATMALLESLMKKIGVSVAAKCAIFKQGERYQGDLIYLAKLPIIRVELV